MTHLQIEDQVRWLLELRRVSRDGGFALLSVHGLFAACFYGLEDIVASRGYHDSMLDKSMDGIAPPSYYRATFQEQEFTTALWSQAATVIEYRQAALGGFQDLIVLRFEKTGGMNELQHDALGQATQ